MQFSFPIEKEIAEKARTIILSDLSQYDSIPAPAKKAGTQRIQIKEDLQKTDIIKPAEFNNGLIIRNC